MGLENVYKNVYQTPFYCKYQYTTLKKTKYKTWLQIYSFFVHQYFIYI